MGGELTIYYMRHGRFPSVKLSPKVCLCLMFFVSLKILIILFALTDPVDPTLPTCSIQEIYTPALNISSNSTAAMTETIYFDLKLWNHEIMNGLIYDPLNLTFSYGAMLQNKSVSATANFTFPGFYQGYAKTAHRRALAETLPVAAASRRILVEAGDQKEELQGFLVSMAILRVELKTAVRFKSMFGKSKRHKLTLGARVEVNDGGQMAVNKGIELTEFSAAATTFGGYYHVLLIAFSSVFILAVPPF